MSGTLVVSGGGSGGHIYPALAVAKAYPARRAVFVGARGHMEARIVPAAGVDFRALPVSGLNRKSLVEKAAGGVRAAYSVLAALALLRRLRPEAVVGTGGYVTGPVGLAASVLSVPLFLLEANVQPGLANRMLFGRAERIFLAFPGTLEHMAPPLRARALVTGYPVRREVLTANRADARRRLGLSPDAFVLLVAGGSQGAQAVNRAAAAVAALGLPLVLLWATGERYFADWRHLSEQPGVRVVPYLDDMPSALAAADAALTRAGASTLAELAVRGLPAVLIPSPNVPDDTQRKNAQYLEREGAALVVEEAELEARIPDAVRALLDPGRRRALAQAMARLARPDALDTIVREIERGVRRRFRSR